MMTVCTHEAMKVAFRPPATVYRMMPAGMRKAACTPQHALGLGKALDATHAWKLFENLDACCFNHTPPCLQLSREQWRVRAIKVQICASPGSHRVDVHACERIHNRRAAQNEHGRHDDVGGEAEAEKHNVRRAAPPRICVAASTLVKRQIISHM